jgi:hypothetical protein
MRSAFLRLVTIMPCLFTACAVAEAAPPLTSVRTWTSADGKFTVQAALIQIADDRVKLRKEDGGDIEVLENSLSVADRDVIDVLRKRQAEKPADDKPKSKHPWLPDGYQVGMRYISEVIPDPASIAHLKLGERIAGKKEIDWSLNLTRGALVFKSINWEPEISAAISKFRLHVPRLIAGKMTMHIDGREVWTLNSDAVLYTSQEFEVAGTAGKRPAVRINVFGAQGQGVSNIVILVPTPPVAKPRPK